MLLNKERIDIIKFCKKMDAGGLTNGTSGNISIFNSKTRLMAISPSSMAYDEMTPEDVVVMDLDAKVIEGNQRPSSEFDMHLTCYKNRPDIFSVIHTHSPKATTLAVLGQDLPAVHYMIAYAGGSTIKCAPYQLFGTRELAASAIKALEGRYACLLGNHGTLAAGPDISYAFSLAQQVEFCADLYLRAKTAGTPRILTDVQISKVIEKAMSAYKKQN